MSLELLLLSPKEEEARSAKETLTPQAVPEAFSQRHRLALERGEGAGSCLQRPGWAAHTWKQHK